MVIRVTSTMISWAPTRPEQLHGASAISRSIRRLHDGGGHNAALDQVGLRIAIDAVEPDLASPTGGLHGHGGADHRHVEQRPDGVNVALAGLAMSRLSIFAMASAPFRVI